MLVCWCWLQLNNMPTCSAPTQPLTAAPTQPASSSAPPHCGRDVCRRCGRCSVTPQPRMWHPPPRRHPSQPCQLLRSRRLPARRCVDVPPPASARRLQQCRPSYRRCGRPWHPFEAPYSSSSSHSESAVGVVAEVTSVNESHHRLHAHRHHGTSTPQHAPRSAPIHAHGVEWCACGCVCACVSVPVCLCLCACACVYACVRVCVAVWWLWQRRTRCVVCACAGNRSVRTPSCSATAAGLAYTSCAMTWTTRRFAMTGVCPWARCVVAHAASHSCACQHHGLAWLGQVLLGVFYARQGGRSIGCNAATVCIVPECRLPVGNGAVCWLSE